MHPHTKDHSFIRLCSMRQGKLEDVNEGNRNDCADTKRGMESEED